MLFPFLNESVESDLRSMVSLTNRDGMKRYYNKYDSLSLDTLRHKFTNYDEVRHHLIPSYADSHNLNSSLTILRCVAKLLINELICHELVYYRNLERSRVFNTTQSRFKEVDTRCTALELRIDNLEEQNKQLYTQLEQQSSSLNFSISSLQSQNQELSQELDLVKSTLTSQISDLEAKLQASDPDFLLSQVDEYYAEMQKALNEAVEFESRCSSLDLLLSEAQAQRDSLLSRVESLQTQCDQLVAENTQISAKCDQLVAENTQISAKCDQLVAENTQISAKCDQLVAENAEIKAENAEIKAELVVIRAENVSLHDKLNDLISKVDSLAESIHRQERDFDHATISQPVCSEAEAVEQRTKCRNIIRNAVVLGMEFYYADSTTDLLIWADACDKIRLYLSYLSQWTDTSIELALINGALSPLGYSEA